MAKRLTQEEFEERLKQVHGDKIECLEKYERIDKKIKFRCNICDYE